MRRLDLLNPTGEFEPAPLPDDPGIHHSGTDKPALAPSRCAGGAHHDREAPHPLDRRGTRASRSPNASAVDVHSTLFGVVRWLSAPFSAAAGESGSLAHQILQLLDIARIVRVMVKHRMAVRAHRYEVGQRVYRVLLVIGDLGQRRLVVNMHVVAGEVAVALAEPQAANLARVGAVFETPLPCPGSGS